MKCCMCTDRRWFETRRGRGDGDGYGRGDGHGDYRGEGALLRTL